MSCSIAHSQINVNIYRGLLLFEEFKASDSVDATNNLHSFLTEYHQKGYISASFDSIEFDSLNIDAYLFLGKKYSWNEVNFVFPALKPSRVKTFSEKTVNFQDLDLEIKKISEFYENSGFPFVNISFDSLVFDKNTISTQIIVNQGDLIVYDSLFFDPKVRTKTKFLQNYLDFKKDKPYNEQQISNLENKLSTLSFISVTQPPEIEFHTSSADLFLYLTNAKVNQLSGLVGFTNVDNKFSLVGQLNFVFVNTFRNADVISLKWQKNKEQSQDLNFNVSIPYIFSTSIGFSNIFSLQKLDTSYVNVKNRFDVNYYFSGFNNASTYISAERSIVFDTSLNLVDYSALIYGIAMRFEKIDNIINPSKGYFAQFSVGTGRKTISDSTTNLFQSEINFGFYYPIFTHFVVHYRNYSHLIYSDYLFENELFKFGGMSYMRGFDEQSLSASSLFLNTLELRYLFDKKSNVFLFTDYAIFEHNTISEHFWNHPFGVGIGLNLGTKAGIFSLSYALGKSDTTPILLKNAKVHFGFKTLF